MCYYVSIKKEDATMDVYDEIYYSLLGELTEEAALPWVPNAFAPSGECAEAYERLLEARNRILERLGVGEDADLEQMLTEMDAIQRSLCRQVMGLRNTKE